MVSVDAADRDAWRTRFSLLLWLAMLLKNPFDIDSVCSNGGANFVSDALAAFKKAENPPNVRCLSLSLSLSLVVARDTLEILLGARESVRAGRGRGGGVHGGPERRGPARSRRLKGASSSLSRKCASLVSAVSLPIWSRSTRVLSNRKELQAVNALDPSSRWASSRTRLETHVRKIQRDFGARVLEVAVCLLGRRFSVQIFLSFSKEWRFPRSLSSSHAQSLRRWLKRDVNF